MHSLFRSRLEVAETQKYDGCGTNFQFFQFLTYRHIDYIIETKHANSWEKNIFDNFCEILDTVQITIYLLRDHCKAKNICRDNVCSSNICSRFSGKLISTVFTTNIT